MFTFKIDLNNYGRALARNYHKITQAIVLAAADAFGTVYNFLVWDFGYLWKATATAAAAAKSAGDGEQDKVALSDLVEELNNLRQDLTLKDGFKRDNNRHDVRTSTWLEPPRRDKEGLTSVMEEIVLNILKALGEDSLDKIQEKLDEIIKERQALRRDKKRWDKQAFQILKLEREQRKEKRRIRKEKNKLEKQKEKERVQEKNPDSEWVSNAARDLKLKQKEIKARRKAEQKERKRAIKSRVFRAWNEMQAQKRAEKEWRELELLPIIQLEEELRKNHRDWQRKFKQDFKQQEKEIRAQRKAERAQIRKEFRSKIIQEELEREARRKSARERRKQALKEILKKKIKPARKNSKEVSQVSISSEEEFEKSVKGLPIREYASHLLREPRLFRLLFRRIRSNAKRGKPITESQVKSEIKRSQGTEGERSELRLVQMGNKWQLWRKVVRTDGRKEDKDFERQQQLRGRRTRGPRVH
ncbi:trichohyalin-like [Macrobrachium nipponense]|uniref:trichohyalin-like n=1 Tax=Macrobrachium nipponense TaxID=159736 RepID=UPI0030C7BFA0